MQKFYAVGGGCGGVGSITWETPLDSFLQASTVSDLVDQAENCSLKNLNSEVTSVVQGEQAKGLSPEAFSYNGDSPLNTRSQALIDSMNTVDETVLNEIVEGIQSVGDNHRYEEAYTSYCKRLEEYQRRYNEELCPAVDTYNRNVDAHNTNEANHAANDPTYTPSYVHGAKVHVNAGQETAPSIEGTVNPSIDGASDLQSKFKDITDFYNEYVVPAKELHDECSNSEYVEAQPVPEYEFQRYPKEWYEYVGDFFSGVGDFFAGLASTTFQVGSAIVNGAVHLVEDITDGVLWAGGHILGGIVGGLGIMFGGDGSAGRSIVEGTNKAVEYGWADGLNEAFYSTALGKAIDNHAWFGFTHDSTGYKVITGVGEVAGVVVGATAATILSGGAALPFILGAAAGMGSTAESVYKRTDGKDTVLGTAEILGMGAISGIGWAATGGMGAGFVEGLTGITPHAATGLLGRANTAFANGPLGGMLASSHSSGVALGERFAGTSVGGNIAARFAPSEADQLMSAGGAMDGATGIVHDPAAVNGAPMSASDSAFAPENMTDDAFNAIQNRAETDALRNAGGALDAGGAQHAPAYTEGAPLSASDSAFAPENMTDDAFNAMQNRVETDALRNAGGALDAGGAQHAPAYTEGAPLSASDSAFAPENMTDDAFNAMQNRVETDALRNAGGALDAGGAQHAPAYTEGAPLSASDSAFAPENMTDDAFNAIQDRQTADFWRNHGSALDGRTGVQYESSSVNGAPWTGEDSAFHPSNVTDNGFNVYQSNSSLSNAQLAGRQGGYVRHANSLADEATAAVNQYGAESTEAQNAINRLQETAEKINITGDQIGSRGMNSSYGTGQVITGPNAGARTRPAMTIEEMDAARKALGNSTID